VNLARSAEHAATLYHHLGDVAEEEHARQLVRHYMDSARRTRNNEPLPFPSKH
jgi:hypothetical protein